MTSGASAQRPTGLPSPEQLTELLHEPFARAGYEIEAVTVDAGRRPARITVVADGDDPLDLDTIAKLSRLASECLDAADTGDTAYVLEVTSPGVQRPLTAEKHFRRARARKAEVHLAGGTTFVGRIAAAGGGQVDFVVPQSRGWALRTVPLAEIRNAVVQVEFSAPKPQELELLATTEDQR